MRILCDADGVLLNFSEAAVNLSNKLFGTAYNTNNITQWDFCSTLCASPEAKKLLWENISSPGFVESIQPYSNAKQLVNAIRQKHELVIVTAPISTSKTWAYERYDSLYRHFGIEPSEVVIASKKQFVSGACLIDDKTENLQSWRHNGRTILVKQLYNHVTPDCDYVVTQDNLLSIVDIINNL